MGSKTKKDLPTKKIEQDDDTDQLRKLLLFYKKVLDNSCDEIFVADNQGITIYANHMSEKHYGLPVSEMLGKSVWELEERGLYFPAATPIALKEKKTITLDQETATGKRLILTATPVFSETGEIEMVICNSRDVTALYDMKKSYYEMKRKTEKNSKSYYKGKGVSEAQEDQLVYADDSPLINALQISQKIARTESIALLQGETGTGKDLFAHYIHNSSNRKDQQFLKVNCAALPKELLESELFGYKGGAFTGANPKGKIGLFSLANGGTIFLDEIGEIPLPLQPKLLQVIEEQAFTPIGSSQVEKINVRIIAATNQDLSQMIKEGLFREDLYYRLCVLSVKIPPLRDRKEDIPVLIEHYLNIFCDKHKRKLTISDEAIKLLNAYHWPGNIRELKHLIEHLTVTAATDLVMPDHLPQHITPSPIPEGQTLKEILEAVERDLIIGSYKELGSSYNVARKFGISQSSATRKIRKYLDLN